MAFEGTARFYAEGRSWYSHELPAVLERELNLDGEGTLLDVGCGPGILTIPLAPLFARAVGLDPSPDMLTEAERQAQLAGIATRIDWFLRRAEDIESFALDRLRVATFGQSFHRTDREAVAEAIYERLEPGGAMVLVVHAVAGRERPCGPEGVPSIPHERVLDVVEEYTGARHSLPGHCAGPVVDGFEAALGRTRFGQPRVVYAPGRPDVIRTIDSVTAGYLALSWVAAHVLGDRLDSFRDDVRRVLEAESADGRFWDWPGDTEIYIAEKR